MPWRALLLHSVVLLNLVPADSRERIQSEDEPQAIIVDVEDVVEETAALMADLPQVQGQVPVYSYAPEEVTQLIDSSGR